MAGRGVDILLGGNPDALAARDVAAEGLDPEADEGRARHAELKAKYEPECAAEGDRVRELGGLYVLGTERHESRRIDNQLRGRSGRQGDPGASRFYLSLDDELMRLFATGAMSWVMGKALPDDVPIEAKMVTKAIERAQRTVEARNFEIRKDVLKYDEVMNEQRKVIYRRRQQILDGGDLRDEAYAAITSALERTVLANCADEFPEDWDLDELHLQMTTTYPTRIAREQLDDCTHRDMLVELFTDEAIELYETKEATIGADNLREIERRVMLSMIDQHWREHLYEMDYLREGINLRAMGQKDPLAEWQREGFDMFEAMMGQIQDQFVAYVSHLQVAAVEEAPRAPATQKMRYSAAEDPVQGSGGFAAAALAGPIEALDDGGGGPMEAGMGGGPAPVADEAPMEPVRVEKTPGRNEPCYCGSGKKYKLCHGR
jgi:preprotein translocase subunit SecA